MTTIQDRIIENFRERNLGCCGGDNCPHYVCRYDENIGNSVGTNHNEVLEDFIIQSIKEVEEETKGDVLNKLHAMVCDLATDKGKDLAKEDCLELIRYQIERIYGKKLLSITNKEK